MRLANLKGALARSAVSLKAAHADESGQGMSEYAIVVFHGLLFGVFAGYWIFPAFVDNYNAYIQGFYLVLGCPFP